MSGDEITYLSFPKGANFQFTENKTEVIIKSSEIQQNLCIFYRSKSMMRPKLLFEESSKFPGEVAIMTSFVPTFEPD